jgi:hypothetical protein
MASNQKFQEIIARLKQYKDAPQEEKQYQLERAIQCYCEGMQEEEKANILILVDMLFSSWAKETVHAALRKDALYPENCVASAKQKLIGTH